MPRSKVYSVSDEEFIKIVEEADSYSDCLRSLGLGTNGGSSTDTLKRRIRELNCDISHFGQHPKGGGNSIKQPMEQILVENSTYVGIARLKERLVKEGILEYKCAECGISKWNNKYLSLHLDHINGINNDHRIENLRFLCPNCHSQTDTYAGKNRKHKK